jgi:hypothetical protein
MTTTIKANLVSIELNENKSRRCYSPDASGICIVSDTERMTFHRNEKGEYEIDRLKVGKISAEQMKQLIAIFKED